MKLLLSKYFLFHLGTYGVYRLLRYNEVQMPELITSYLADYCAMPVILVFILITIRGVKRSGSMEMTTFQVFSVILYMGVLLEYVFPKFYLYMISDPLDIVAYLIGGVSYLTWRSIVRRKQMIIA